VTVSWFDERALNREFLDALQVKHVLGRDGR
jgi:hypothetical protein